MNTLETLAARVEGLSTEQRDFLCRVCDGLKLGLADRKVDKVRQSVRRAGLVFVAASPRRWEPTEDGKSVREYLRARALSKQEGGR